MHCYISRLFAFATSTWNQRHWLVARGLPGHWDQFCQAARGGGSLQADFFLALVLHQLNGDDPISLFCSVTVRISKIMCLKSLGCYETQRRSEFQLL
jgi:hypothetical protein